MNQSLRQNSLEQLATPTIVHFVLEGHHNPSHQVIVDDQNKLCFECAAQFIANENNPANKMQEIATSMLSIVKSGYPCNSSSVSSIVDACVTPACHLPESVFASLIITCCQIEPYQSLAALKTRIEACPASECGPLLNLLGSCLLHPPNSHIVAHEHFTLINKAIQALHCKSGACQSSALFVLMQVLKSGAPSVIRECQQPSFWAQVCTFVRESGPGSPLRTNALALLAGMFTRSKVTMVPWVLITQSLKPSLLAGSPTELLIALHLLSNISKEGHSKVLLENDIVECCFQITAEVSGAALEKLLTLLHSMSSLPAFGMRAATFCIPCLKLVERAITSTESVTYALQLLGALLLHSDFRESSTIAKAATLIRDYSSNHRVHDESSIIACLSILAVCLTVQGNASFMRDGAIDAGVKLSKDFPWDQSLKILVAVLSFYSVACVSRSDLLVREVVPRLDALPSSLLCDPVVCAAVLRLARSTTPQTLKIMTNISMTSFFATRAHISHNAQEAQQLADFFLQFLQLTFKEICGPFFASARAPQETLLRVAPFSSWREVFSGGLLVHDPECDQLLLMLLACCSSAELTFVEGDSFKQWLTGHFAVVVACPLATALVFSYYFPGEFNSPLSRSIASALNNVETIGFSSMPPFLLRWTLCVPELGNKVMMQVDSWIADTFTDHLSPNLLYECGQPLAHRILDTMVRQPSRTLEVLCSLCDSNHEIMSLFLVSGLKSTLSRLLQSKSSTPLTANNVQSICLLVSESAQVSPEFDAREILEQLAASQDISTPLTRNLWMNAANVVAYRSNAHLFDNFSKSRQLALDWSGALKNQDPAWIQLCAQTVLKWDQTLASHLVAIIGRDLSSTLAITVLYSLRKLLEKHSSSPAEIDEIFIQSCWLMLCDHCVHDAEAVRRAAVETIPFLLQVLSASQQSELINLGWTRYAVRVICEKINSYPADSKLPISWVSFISVVIQEDVSFPVLRRIISDREPSLAFMKRAAAFIMRDSALHKMAQSIVQKRLSQVESTHSQLIYQSVAKSHWTLVDGTLLLLSELWEGKNSSFASPTSMLYSAANALSPTEY